MARDEGAAADHSSPHRAVSLPYTSNGLQITPFGQSVRLVAKQMELELVVVWGPGGHLMVRTPVGGAAAPGGRQVGGWSWGLPSSGWRSRLGADSGQEPGRAWALLKAQPPHLKMRTIQ